MVKYRLWLLETQAVLEKGSIYSLTRMPLTRQNLCARIVLGRCFETHIAPSVDVALNDSSRINDGPAKTPAFRFTNLCAAAVPRFLIGLQLQSRIEPIKPAVYVDYVVQFNHRLVIKSVVASGVIVDLNAVLCSAHD